MKSPAILLIFALCLDSLRAERLIPSQLDPALAAEREEAFIPWSDPDASGEYWKKLSPSHVPIYNERKPGFSRDIYIPNPGIAYWVLGGLTKRNLFKIQREKLAIDDILVSASIYKDEKGRDVYWALWAPRNRAYLLTDRMKELGISQARIEYSLSERFWYWASSLKPAEISALTIVLLGLILLVLTLILLVLILHLWRRNVAPSAAGKSGEKQ